MVPVGDGKGLLAFSPSGILIFNGGNGVRLTGEVSRIVLPGAASSTRD